MSKSTTSSSSGISFCGLLTVVFITLKLIGKIDWSWIWVLSPLWAPFLIAVVVFIIVVIAFFVYEFVNKL